jgi:hypothetical protein
MGNEFVEDGTLAGAVLSAQDIHAGMQVPHDVFMAAPKTFYLYASDIICHFHMQVRLML